MEAAYRDMVMSQTHPVVLMLNVGDGYYVETDTTHSRSPDWERGEEARPSPGLPCLIWGRLQILRGSVPHVTPGSASVQCAAQQTMLSADVL